MSLKRTLVATACLTIVISGYMSLAENRELSAQTQTGKLNNHVYVLRTIPKEFGRVIGTVTSSLGNHSLVMEAADGTIRVVPFNQEDSVGLFPRD